MKFFKYWARASAPVETHDRGWKLQCYGGSDTSLADALRNAEEITRRQAAAIESGPGGGGPYGYADRPLREPIVQVLGKEADPYAVVTRNSYGSLVLNTASALFADIDYPATSPGADLFGAVRRLFGKTSSSADEEIIARVRSVAPADGQLGLRLYRTAGGFRCLLTHRTYEPGSDEAGSLLEQLGSDPLYLRLCRAQRCFRARLTPKHWRCGVQRPPSRFPFETAEAEQAFRRWDEEYRKSAMSHSTCAFVAAFGSSSVHEAVAPVVAVHDRIACTEGPLA